MSNKQTSKGYRLDRRIAVAPMMDWTDRHDRYFLRLLAPTVLLYTEMVTTAALLHGDYRYLLQYNPREHPVALQLGGSKPKCLRHCAQLGEAAGYDEINLNVGCPSDRVQSGKMGACLMLEPERVAACVAAMRAAVTIPVTVKCRLGVDQQDSYEDLCQFIQTVAAAGAEIFIIHARKAWLTGLSPKENRDLPPLRYAFVHQLKKDFPHLTIIVNGGIKSLAAVDEHLQAVDGVMIGREAYTNPYFLAELEKKYFSLQEKLPSRSSVIEQLLPYVQEQLKNNTRLSSITRHLLGLFHGQPGANQWRRHLSENAHRTGAGVEVIEAALRLVNIQEGA
jgi:tRNA-dihydrouridine synthase A